MSKLGSIFVLGNASANLILEVEAYPQPGETIRAHTSHNKLGGKGFN